MLNTNPSYIQPKIFEPFRDLIAAESTRHGGVSPLPYASLNLGLYTKDEVDNVHQNRVIFFDKLGIGMNQVAGSFQVHGTKVLVADIPGQYHGYDALISNKPGLFLTVKMADCTPVLLYDPARKVVGAVHAGWRGTVGRIVDIALQEMSAQFGSKPEDCRAYIGTCIDECDFEVDADVADYFETPYKRWDAASSKFLVDLKKSNKAQLLEAGVKGENIEVSPFSTVRHNEHFYSHRKESGKTGRMLAVIGLKKGQRKAR